MRFAPLSSFGVKTARLLKTRAEMGKSTFGQSEISNRGAAFRWRTVILRHRNNHFYLNNMKRLLSFLAVAVCIAQTALAGTVEVKLNLWTGETDLGNWANYVTIATSKLTDAAVGDELQVTVHVWPSLSRTAVIVPRSLALDFWKTNSSLALSY